MPEGSNSAPGFAKHPNYTLDKNAAGKRICVTFNDVVIADSERVLVLTEMGQGPVYYFPQDDVAMDRLTRTDNDSFCGFKGKASYWSVTVGEQVAENAVWSYETPFDEFTDFTEYLAFYWDRMDSWQEDGVTVDNAS
ncbi:MAG: DUF427 domain-containing protein [Alphaproteobacteria bacterium]|nr:DUF427 domain-containing protein [Alphaproteobacteria bacterium]